MTTTIMDHPRTITATGTFPSAAPSRNNSGECLISPSTVTVTRDGRQYLRNVPYPLPIDLAELHRQNFHTMLMHNVFGKSLCSPFAEQRPPQTVLEVACGTGFWSASCHDYLAELGCLNVSFTGIDIAPLAPNYRAQGMNWRFVEHDIRMVPFPFEDESFDLVVFKDVSLVLPNGQPSQLLLDEALRLLRSGGTLEIWETDHLLRSILRHTPHLPTQPPDTKGTEDIRQALATATFEITPATPFGPVESTYLEDYNSWMQKLLDRRKLTPLPCARMLPMLLQETDDLCDIGSRRVAIPLMEMIWEDEDRILSEAREWALMSDRRRPSQARLMNDAASTSSSGQTALSKEQRAIRSTALSSFTQLVESVEPLLREVSGKSSEDWCLWWNCLMEDLHDEDSASSGACLEIGAFWAKKR